jgi:enamine deaminase RidA (YjgF/YER057c/UK114 family)
MAAAPANCGRTNFAGGSVWEPRVGYSRAVRVGASVFVSGTTASSEGAALEGLDAYAQARATLQIVLRALAAAGARAEHVVRTRMFVVDIAANAAGVGRAHGEVFTDIRPAASMLGVAALIDPLMLVEIEADAIIHEVAAAAGAPVTPATTT